jgi:Ala-tRNA(Pro) deacylase
VSRDQEEIMGGTEESGQRGVDLVTGYLDGQGVAHEVVEHEQTFTAAAEAKASGVAPDHAAKTMVLRDADSYRLAVIPASHRLDLGKVREALGATRHLRLATEAEMESDFESFEVGALPPIGPMLPAPEILDTRLSEHDRILCAGGDHRHSVLVAPQDLARVTDARIADVCED